MDKSSREYLEVYQGISFDKSFTWVAGDTNIPVNLTGYTAKIQVREEQGGLVVLELSTANGRIVLPSPLTSGVINLVLTGADTADLRFTFGVWSLVLTSPTGVSTMLLDGWMCLLPGATQ